MNPGRVTLWAILLLIAAGCLYNALHDTPWWLFGSILIPLAVRVGNE